MYLNSVPGLVDGIWKNEEFNIMIKFDEFT